MASAEIIVSTGISGGAVFEHKFLDGPTAISDGHDRFREILSQRGDWLLQACIARDFNDNLLVNIRLRIGPLPYWDDEYLKEHRVGKYGDNALIGSKIVPNRFNQGPPGVADAGIVN